MFRCHVDDASEIGLGRCVVGNVEGVGVLLDHGVKSTGNVLWRSHVEKLRLQS